MTLYKIGGATVEKGDHNFETLLAAAYGARQRPKCLCRPGGVDMYVARIDERYVIKRMPYSADDHDPVCTSYEPPPELSGLGEVLESAIIEVPDLDATTLKLQFALTKSGGRAAPKPDDGDVDSVKTDARKLSLRALLHFLWEQAGFHKWSPAMHGKRHWAVLRKYLLQAARHKQVKGYDLSDLLYIPEPFTLERKQAIAHRRTAQLAQVAQTGGHQGQRRLLVLIAEVKDFAPSRNGHKLVVRHSADFPFMLGPGMNERLLKRFDQELSLWGSIDGTHLVTIATFGVNQAGVATIEEMALMATTENWLPFENRAEKSLLDMLTADGRRFLIGLRYNLPQNRPLAVAVLADTKPPTAMFVPPIGSGDDYAAALAELIDGSKMTAWVWHPESGDMPHIARPA
ncbi:DUF1173 domain-containing protein [Duganella sp. FT27W]|uniref:DUF1173 domain-containing protein n=1 Tax=Duganella sp. FT27W TaxID=2654636 RepID=UPI00128DE0B7|nr:DUF1173 domain-containing protein [Duganella sp. FT27W]MPQ55142.1 DUF1173 family protein [Duganella sp. FT27W]